MELSRYEQETIINYNKAEKAASIYTHNRALRRKLERLAEERPEDCHIEFGNADVKDISTFQIKTNFQSCISLSILAPVFYLAFMVL